MSLYGTLSRRRYNHPEETPIIDKLIAKIMKKKRRILSLLKSKGYSSSDPEAHYIAEKLSGVID